MAALQPYGPRTGQHLVQHFNSLPHYPTKLYWDDWGPVFYRGRLDGAAKVLGVAQDPGVCEHVARRVLVGTAGQRVQFLLETLGLCHSYVLVNAHQYEIRGGHQRHALSASKPSSHSESTRAKRSPSGHHPMPRECST
jgi:hypothetical protein